jgi:hypothetical protein
MTEPAEDPHADFKGVKPVEDRHKLDEAALGPWLKANVEGYTGPLTINQFKGGQSNPTYQLVTPSRKYVLRKKPGGKLLPSAHAVDREFRVMSALYPTGFPVARQYALCTDDSVLGAMFYVMEMVEGRVLWNGALPEMTKADRRATYENKIATLAKLHNTDHEKIGLGDYGKPGNYFGRQIDRWSKQYKFYEMARKGEEVELAPRKIMVHHLEVLEWTPPEVVIDVHCSSGTYVRSLANDLGQKLGCGAYLVGLRRTKSGRFTLRDATPLRKLQEAFNAGNWYQYLIPAAEALGDWPSIELSPDEVEGVRHGHRVKAKEADTVNEKVRGVSTQGELVALMELNVQADGTKEWQPKKVFFTD